MRIPFKNVCHALTIVGWDKTVSSTESPLQVRDQIQNGAAPLSTVPWKVQWFMDGELGPTPTTELAMVVLPVSKISIVFVESWILYCTVYRFSCCIYIKSFRANENYILSKFLSRATNFGGNDTDTWKYRTKSCSNKRNWYLGGKLGKNPNIPRSRTSVMVFGATAFLDDQNNTRVSGPSPTKKVSFLPTSTLVAIWWIQIQYTSYSYLLAS